MTRLLLALLVIALFLSACSSAVTGTIVSNGFDEQGHFVKVQPFGCTDRIRCGVENLDLWKQLQIGEMYNCQTGEHWREAEG